MSLARRASSIATVALAALLGACASYPPLRTVDNVDLPRFMGRWYVIAAIPTFIEDEAYNAVESYALADDGSIETTFTFRDGGFDGEQRRYTPRGFVRDSTSNAVWGMQFVWPFEAEYRIVYLDADYALTVIGRSKRDYVWIMAREPHIEPAAYRQLLALIEAEGYDLGRLRKVPQRWSADG